MSEWTLEDVKKKALQFTTRVHFANGYKGDNEPQDLEAVNAYKVAVNNNWLDEVCEHMPLPTGTGGNSIMGAVDITFRYRSKEEMRREASDEFKAYSIVLKREHKIAFERAGQNKVVLEELSYFAH